MSLSALAEIEKVEMERRAAAEARKQELRAVEYHNLRNGDRWVSLTETEGDALLVAQKLLADDDYEVIAILSWEKGDARRAEIIIANRQAREAKEREEEARRNTPVVGKGATVRLFTDCQAYAVVGVSPSGKQVKLLRLRPEALGIEVGPLKNFDQGGYPVVGHYFTDEEIEAALADTTNFTANDFVTAHLRKNGRYYQGGCPVNFISATELTDYRF